MEIASEDDKSILPIIFELTYLTAAHGKAAMERHQHHKILPIDPPLLLTRAGDRLTRSGLNSAMQRLKKKMADHGLEDTYWNLHLLKSKSVSDSKDKRIAGHRSEAMRERYNQN